MIHLTWILGIGAIACLVAIFIWVLLLWHAFRDGTGERDLTADEAAEYLKNNIWISKCNEPHNTVPMIWVDPEKPDCWLAGYITYCYDDDCYLFEIFWRGATPTAALNAAARAIHKKESEE